MPRHVILPILALLTGSFLLGYLLLEKKLLPRSWWPNASRFYFYPMMVPSLLVRLASGQSYFSDVDEGVLLGATPMVIAGHVTALHRAGVRAVVNMQAEYGGPVDAYAALHPPIVQLWIPVVDHTEPSIEQLEAAVKFIAKHRARGERVLVHCKGGHGRSAAVVMAWMIYSEQDGSMTPEAAQQRLDAVRDVRKTLYTQPAIREFYARNADSGRYRRL